MLYFNRFTKQSILSNIPQTRNIPQLKVQYIFDRPWEIIQLILAQPAWFYQKLLDALEWYIASNFLILYKLHRFNTNVWQWQNSFFFLLKIPSWHRFYYFSKLYFFRHLKFGQITVFHIILKGIIFIFSYVLWYLGPKCLKLIHMARHINIIFCRSFKTKLLIMKREYRVFFL